MKLKYLLIPMFSLLLSSCSLREKTFDNTLPSKTFEVTYDLNTTTNKATLQCEFDYSEVNIYREDLTKFSKDDIIGGDKLIVYYKNTDMKKIDHVIIDEAKSLEAIISDEPGNMDARDFINEEWIINGTAINYVIDNDYSLIPLHDVKLNSTLYGIYNEFEERVNKNFCRLLYAFTFNPRIS